MLFLIFVKIYINAKHSLFNITSFQLINGKRILTHRAVGYHPDHRAYGQSVMDCAYKVTVPLFCPEATYPSYALVILCVREQKTSTAQCLCSGGYKTHSIVFCCFMRWK